MEKGNTCILPYSPSMIPHAPSKFYIIILFFDGATYWLFSCGQSKSGFCLVLQNTMVKDVNMFVVSYKYFFPNNGERNYVQVLL